VGQEGTPLLSVLLRLPLSGQVTGGQEFGEGQVQKAKNPLPALGVKALLQEEPAVLAQAGQQIGDVSSCCRLSHARLDLGDGLSQ
jgi:hypothetical protein